MTYTAFDVPSQTAQALDVREETVLEAVRLGLFSGSLHGLFFSFLLCPARLLAVLLPPSPRLQEVNTTI